VQCDGRVRDSGGDHGGLSGQARRSGQEERVQNQATSHPVQCKKVCNLYYIIYKHILTHFFSRACANRCAMCVPIGVRSVCHVCAFGVPCVCVRCANRCAFGVRCVCVRCAMCVLMCVRIGVPCVCGGVKECSRRFARIGLRTFRNVPRVYFTSHISNHEPFLEYYIYIALHNRCNCFLPFYFIFIKKEEEAGLTGMQ
jgi:hypothetical protein